MTVPSIERRIGESAKALIARLKALRENDRAVLDLVALGPAAIPELREFLFQREPSGLFQARCDAVAALAALHAEDILLDFLVRSPALQIADPVERTGEDAVINAAARALGRRRDDACFAALMAIAEQRPMAGVIEALGEMGRDLAIPRLVEGLSSDFTRNVAGAALAKFGARSRPILVAVALNPRPSEKSETTNSLRMRWSALGVLAAIGVRREEWSLLGPLTQARDPRLAALACHLALATNQQLPDREAAVGRLIGLLKIADWLLTLQIEGWLAEASDLTLRVINRAVDRGDRVIRDEAVRTALLRVIGRGAGERLSAAWLGEPAAAKDGAAEDGAVEDGAVNGLPLDGPPGLSPPAPG